jgi:hypothetical protein
VLERLGDPGPDDREEREAERVEDRERAVGRREAARVGDGHERGDEDHV